MDQKGRCVGHLDREARLQKVTVSGNVVRHLPLKADFDLSRLQPETIVSAELKTPMKTVVEISHCTGLPIPIVGEKGRLVGVVGPSDIFRGILREIKPPAKGKRTRGL